MSPTAQVLVVLALLVLSAFFSVAEISLAGARRLKLQGMADAGDARAAAVMALQERPGHFFTVVQVGLNTVAILGGIVGEGALSPGFDRLLRAAGVPDAWAGSLGFVLSFAVVTALFIQFADLIPKRLAMAQPEAWAVAIVGPMRTLTRALAPLVAVFNGVADLFFRVTGLPAAREDRVTTADVVAMVEAGADSGALQGNEHRLIGNVLGLAERPVAAAMTPRDSIVFLDLTEDHDTLRKKMLGGQAESFLVCRERIDNVTGFLELRDLLPLLAEPGRQDLQAALGGLALRTPLVVPDSLTLGDLLDRFKATRQDFAVIVNEYALVVGTVSLDDLVRSLMDRIVVDPSDQQIVQRGPDSWLVDGMAQIGDLKRLVGVDHAPGEEGYDTAAGFMMFMMKRIPRRAEGFEFAGHRFEAVDIDNFRIDQLMVTRLPGVEHSR